jgi:hypothetical protein
LRVAGEEVKGGSAAGEVRHVRAEVVDEAEEGLELFEGARRSGGLEGLRFAGTRENAGGGEGVAEVGRAGVKEEGFGEIEAEVVGPKAGEDASEGGKGGVVAFAVDEDVVEVG